MKTTISRSTFINDFNAIRPDSFSYEALGAIYDYFEMLEDECGMSIEFDPVAVCSLNGKEYGDAVEALEVYDDELLNGWCRDDDRDELAMNYLQDRTQVITFAGGIVILDF